MRQVSDSYWLQVCWFSSQFPDFLLKPQQRIQREKFLLLAVGGYILAARDGLCLGGVIEECSKRKEDRGSKKRWQFNLFWPWNLVSLAIKRVCPHCMHVFRTWMHAASKESHSAKSLYGCHNTHPKTIFLVLKTFSSQMAFHWRREMAVQSVCEIFSCLFWECVTIIWLPFAVCIQKPERTTNDLKGLCKNFARTLQWDNKLWWHVCVWEFQESFWFQLKQYKCWDIHLQCSRSEKN